MAADKPSACAAAEFATRTWARRAVPAALALALLGTAGCRSHVPDMPGLPAKVDFNFHVRPILSDKCFACHGPDDRARKGGLSLHTREGAFATLPTGRRAVVAGEVGESELVRRIRSSDPSVRMPTPDSHLTLDELEKATLVRWVEQGATWTPHWAFAVPEKRPLPTGDDIAPGMHTIDAFVRAGLRGTDLTPAPEASREAWIRRVSFDLTGLPPTVAEIDAFASDRAPNAYETVVDRLLASPAYGERMAVDWLDVARYADSHGYQDDGMRQMSPWRDWVIAAFNRNMPVDQFVTWQLAGDLLPGATTEQRLATAFNRNHMQSQEGGIVSEEYRTEYVADRVNTLGSALLGVSLECARCHDHKYDPVLQKDYFRMFAFFNNVNETGQIPYSGVPSPTVTLSNSKADAALSALAQQMAPLVDATRTERLASGPAFEAWVQRVNRTRGPHAVTLPRPIVHLPLDALVEYRLANLATRRRAGTVGSDEERKKKTARTPVTVPGHKGMAQRLVGDSHIDLGGVDDEFAFFERNEPFSFAVWVRLEKAQVAGPLVTRSGGVMNGLRGYELLVRADGTLSAGLHHVAPDNSIEIETTRALKPGTWHHVAVTYDGSSRAAGLRVFVDGAVAARRVLVDNLTRSMIDEPGGNHGGLSALRLGRRADETLSDVSVDEFFVYPQELTAIEVAALAGVEDPLGTAAAAAGRVGAGLVRRTPGNGRTSPSDGRTSPTATRDTTADGRDTTADGRDTTADGRVDSAATREALEALGQHYALRVDRSATAARRRLQALRGQENSLITALPQVMVMRELPPERTRPTFVLARGAYDAPTERVEPDTPKAILPFDASLPRNRLGLARWLFSPRHPLTSRVLVNRYWALLFGTGIVPTPEDFGNQGKLPTHPELLDALAIDFRESGWNLKGLLRQIVLSKTYRQSSVATPQSLERDPGNAKLARGPAYRMATEQIRDNALAGSGLLVRTIGGPSVYPYQPAGLWEELATRNATTYVQGKGDDLYRRSLYTVWKRTTPPPSAISFDASERLFCTVRRQRTSTPLQALVLLNDPQYVEASRVLAERVMVEGGDTPEARITLAFRLLTSRVPSAGELSALQSLFTTERTRFASAPASARALRRVGARAPVAALDPVDVAAYAVVASTIMNLDEAVNKR